MRSVAQYCEDGIETAWLFALIITPLFFNVYSFRIFEPDKVALLRSLALLVLAGWLIKSIVNRGIAAGDRLRLLTAACRRRLAAPILTIAVAHILSTVFSVAPTESLFGSYHRLQGTLTTFSYLILFVAVATHVRRRQQVRRVLATVALTSLPIALYAIIQHLGWDPLLPWDSDVRQRPPANLGNPTFLGGYLAMSALIVLGLVTTSVHALVARERHRFKHVVSAVGHGLILVLNLVAIGLTQSRGPLLGLYVGLNCFWILVAAVLRLRRVAVVALALLALPALFIALLNVRTGPLERVREWETFGRLAASLDTQQGSVGVRTLIWEGLFDLVMPHTPLRFPDGRTDTWNILRPVIGYGPESIGVVFNLVSRPELQRLDNSEAFVDRAHNETLDVLATTGAVGAVGYLGLFILLFSHGLRRLGVRGGRHRRRAFGALVLGCGIVSVVSLWIWRGPAFFGLAVPLGVVSAVLIHVGVSAAQGGASQTAPRRALDVERTTTLIALFAAIVAHFVEISVGIATVSTRTHVWIFAALLLAFGPSAAADPVAHCAAPLPNSDETNAETAASRKPAAAGLRRPVAMPPWRDGLVSAVPITLVLVTLGYNYVTLDVRTVGWGRVPVASPANVQAGIPSWTTIGLFLVTWLGGAGLACSDAEPRVPTRRRGCWLTVLGVPLALGGLAWIFTSWQARVLSRITATDLPSILSATDKVATLITYYAVTVLCLLLAAPLLAAARHPRAGGGLSACRPTGRLHTSLFLVGCAIPAAAALWLAFVLNLRVVHADTAYNIGRRLGPEQKAVTMGLYERAMSLAPQEKYYQREVKRLLGP